MKQICLAVSLLLLVAAGHAQVSATGSITAEGTTCATTNACVSLPLVNSINASSGGVTLTVSANAGSNTLSFEATGDGVTWVALNATPLNSTSPATSTTSTGTWQANVAGLVGVRVRCSSYSSGTSVVSIQASTASARLGGGGGGGGTGCVPAGSAGDLLTDDGSGACNSLTDFVFTTHTLAGGASSILNMAPATGTAAFKVPSHTTNTASAAAVIDYDSTGKNYHIFANSADAIIAPFASAPTTGHCVQATVSGGNVLLSDSGSSNCGGGGSVAWSGISNPSGNLALSMGTDTSIFTGTAATNQFFAFKNSTAAVVGTSQGSPILSTCGRAFHGSADVEDCLTLGELPGNGNDAAITFTVGHTGTSTGTVTTAFPGPVQAGVAGGVGGTLDLPEGTAASAASGHDIIYADSTSHRPKMLNNNGSADLIVGANTTDTLVNKTLTAPVLGAATATSINKMAITAPATSSTLAVADGKTLTASNSITLAGTDSTTMTFPSVSATIPRVVASGTSAMGTSAISSGTCATVVTASATGTLTTDAIIATPNADPTGVTGYAVSATGGVYIAAYPTADNVNFKVCNNTAGSLTPSALTMNWRVIR